MDMPVATSPGLVVDTVSGRLRGTQAGPIAGFMGIPYAASPSGRNRFLPPLPLPPWTGTRDALAYAGHAPQAPDRPKRRAEVDMLLGPADTTPEGEDCLTLNVWTPGCDAAAERPVMVWLHGGAFAYGSGNRPVIDGGNLARRGDVVVVSVNHRLNIFGFLDLSGIAGAEYAGSGNAGVLDLVAALEWVRDNIKEFGGDPGNVTIFGESGGGGKVSVLLAMPKAHGLFHRAVIQSGATVRVRTRERAAALTDAVLRHLGLGAGDWQRLRAVPAARLLAAMAPASRAVGPTSWRLLDRYDFGPVVDGSDLPQQPFDPGAPPLSRDIPLLIGGTRDESALFLTEDKAVWERNLSEAELRQRIAALAGGETDALIELYRTTRPDARPDQRLIAMLTGSNFWVRTVLLAERKAAAGGAPVYMYSLDWGTPNYGGRLGAHHAIDLPFVFDNAEIPGTTAGAPGAAALAATISASWAAFARTGNPAIPSLPRWPAYTAAERATMVFDADCRIVGDPDREARLCWTRIATG